jgi:hypothetical protein
MPLPDSVTACRGQNCMLLQSPRCSAILAQALGRLFLRQKVAKLGGSLSPSRRDLSVPTSWQSTAHGGDAVMAKPPVGRIGHRMGNLSGCGRHDFVGDYGWTTTNVLALKRHTGERETCFVIVNRPALT